MSGELKTAGTPSTAATQTHDIPGGAVRGTCLNCGAGIFGPFCAQCGQAWPPHRSVSHVADEFLHGLLHFDTKSWRTLPMVIFRPGVLTRNYVYGKRARYIPPLALFLFTILFMFFVFAFLPPPEHSAPAPDATWGAEAAHQLAQIEQFNRIPGWENIRRNLHNPELAFYKVQQAAYKFSFLLAPLSLPFIALLFLGRRGVTLYDHVVYALYALSFASLLFLAVTFAGRYSWSSGITPLLMLTLPVHTYVHLKGAYALSWPSAVWRTLLMLIFATLVALIFLLLIVMLGLAH